MTEYDAAVKNHREVASGLAELAQAFQMEQLLSNDASRKKFLDNLVPVDNQILLLGESSHGTEEFYQLRAMITKHLIETRDYRVLLIEAEWPDVYALNQYIHGASPATTAKEALTAVQGFGRHMWQNYVFSELLDWLKAFNKKLDYQPSMSVSVFGIDCQQIYRSLNSLYESLTTLDFNYCMELRSRLSFFAGYTDESEYARRTVTGIGSEIIPETLQKILSEFQWEHFDRLKAMLPKERVLEMINIEQNLEVLVGGEEYFRKRQLEPAGSQVSWNTRDQHMTLTVNRIRERLSLVTGHANPRLMLWAHNSHIGNAGATARGGQDFTRNETWNLGQMVKQTFKDSFLMGFDTYNGTVTALNEKGADDRTRSFDLRNAVVGSSEYFLHLAAGELRTPAFFLPLRHVDRESHGLTREQVEQFPLHQPYSVCYRDVPVYESQSPTAEKRGSRLQFGDSFEAVERAWLPHGSSRLRRKEGGWVDEFHTHSGITLRCRPLSLAYPEQPDQFLLHRMPQRYVGVNYCPDTELESHYHEGSLGGQYHGLIFVDHTSALKVLDPAQLAPPGQKAGAPKMNMHGVKRLAQEYRQLARQPIPNIRVAPLEDNLFICHFLILGQGDYEGGEYHGRLEFPSEYPMAPPKIFFMTPSGRFEVDRKICVSFSDYHPELWNPSWGVESVLVGLLSFMLEDSEGSLGSITASTRTRKEFAKKSHEYNMKNETYRSLFGEGSELAMPAELPPAEEGEDRFCRYCRSSGGELVEPCDCRGGNQWVHAECLAKWQYQAILGQSTHPKYQTGLERRCNVCQAEFRVKAITREQLMLNFTGAEMASLIQLGVLLIATEKSSAHNLRLMEQYSDNRNLCENLRHWTKSVFLMTQIIRVPGKQKESIVGVNLGREISASEAKKLSKGDYDHLKNCSFTLKHYVGGPVAPREASLVVAFRLSAFKDIDPGLDRVTFFEQEDLCLAWLNRASELKEIQRSTRLSQAVVEVRAFWGVAGWDRVQLLGEIARGGWGLARPQAASWLSPQKDWERVVKTAVVAGKNAFSDKHDS